MGSQGSGRYTVRSKAFDIADHLDDVLRHLERHLLGDSERDFDFRTLERWKSDAETLRRQLCQAMEREG